MEAVANGGFNLRRRRKLSNGHVVPQLLETTLPTPRRSSCASAADAPTPIPHRFSADAPPQQRRLVPFSWETTPGVPRSAAKGREVVPPKPPPPPPGRFGAGAPCRASRETTTTDGSSEGDAFSDALDRTSSSDRLALAALSSRLSSTDSLSRRSPSFIMDRFLPAANAIATTSADIHPRRAPSPRRRRDKDDGDEEEAAAARTRARQVLNSPRCPLVREQPPKQQKSEGAAAQAPLSPLANEEEQGDVTSAKVCGLMFFFPWRAKPVLLRISLSSRRNNRTSNAASVTAAASPPRRSVTLGDVLEMERKLQDEKSGSGEELSGLGWGTTLLGTSKRYCSDARKALSRLTRSTTDGGDGPSKLCRERRGGKQAASVPRSISDKMPPLSPPSESWLCHARRSNAASGKR